MASATVVPSPGPTTTATATPSSNRLSLESIPTVDLRLLTQSELTALSLCSTSAFDLRRCDDVVIPKIDRSVFNESAGSRKQTYSRLRLAPRNKTSVAPPPPKPEIPPPLLDSERAENSRIVNLFKNLFNLSNGIEEEDNGCSGSGGCGGGLSVSVSSRDGEEESELAMQLIPVSVSYCDNLRDTVPGPVNHELLVIDGNRKRKRGSKAKGETVSPSTLGGMNVSNSNPSSSSAIVVAVMEEEDKMEGGVEVEVKEEGMEMVVVVDEEEEKRKKEERERELVNKNGVVVNLAELAKMEDPYREGLTRMTVGKELAEELLEFVGNLEGEWGSRRKKRKTVDANVFGDALPNGWKVLIAIKKKLGRAWVFCRRYISPNGRYFVSCKEVSSYLLSLTGPQELDQQPSVHDADIPIGDSIMALEKVVEVETKADCLASAVAFQLDDPEKTQMQLCVSQAVEQEKQLTFPKEVTTGEVQAAFALKCHKCSTPFSEKDELLTHLVSCHKRKRRKSGASIDDNLLVKDGKYECQFCNKSFSERNSYFGHVGVHVKNHVRSIGGTPGLAAKQKTSEQVTIDEFSVTPSVTSESADMNVLSVASTPNTLANSDLLLDSKFGAASDVEQGLDCGNKDQNGISGRILPNFKSTQNDKTSVGNSSGNDYSTSHTVVENGTVVDKTGGNVKPDDYSGSGKSLVNEENVQCKNRDNNNAAECVVSEEAKSSALIIESAEACLYPASKLVDQGNGSDFVSTDVMDCGRVPCDSAPPANNKENSSRDQNSGDGSLRYKTVDQYFYDGVNTDGADVEENSSRDQNSGDGSLRNKAVDQYFYDVVITRAADNNSSRDHNSGDGFLVNKTVDQYFYDAVNSGDNEKLTDGSASGDFDHAMNAEDDVLDSGKLEECSAIPHEEENYSVAVNRFAHNESTGSDSKVERGSSAPSSVHQTSGLHITEGRDFTGLVNETDMDFCSLGNTRLTIESDMCVTRDCRETHSVSSLVSKDYGSGYLDKGVVSASDAEMMQSTGAGGFQIEQSSSPENSSRQVSINGIEDKSDQVLNSSNLFYGSGRSDTDLHVDDMTNTDQSHTDVSNLLGAFGSFAEDKQEQVPKSMLSDLSMNEDPHEMSMKNIVNVSSSTTTMHLPEFDKMESSRPNKLVPGFGNMPEMNETFLNPVQHDTVSQVSSPFQLWGQQLCGFEDNNTKVYSGARGVAQQERAPVNSSLNLVGLQQPSNAGYNLNEVCMNQQNYVQHNESGVFSRSNEVRREDISHSSTLNLAGFQQQCDAGYNLNKPCINQQNYGVQHAAARTYSSQDEARQERVNYGNSLSLASVQQTCDSRYNLNKAGIQQTCETGYSLNKGYIESMHGLSKLNELGRSQDRDLMIGFGSSTARSNQAASTDFMWRSPEANTSPGGLVASSSSRGQSSGSFQAFDFLSDKGGNDLYTDNDKFDNMSSFEGLRANVEPMEFSFMTTQASNAQLEHPKVLQYNTQMDQGFGGSLWNQKAASLPNMMPGHVVSTLCVWCGNEFHQDPLACEMQAGSIGYLCPTCKARMSGQFL